MKKILSLLTVLMILCAMIPAAGLAGEPVFAYVAGIALPYASNEDILGDGSLSLDTSGSVPVFTLDYTTMVLSGGTLSAFSFVTIPDTVDTVKFRLIGDNTIDLASGNEFIRADSTPDFKLHFTGNGSLTVIGGSTMSDQIIRSYSITGVTIGEAGGTSPTINLLPNYAIPVMLSCERFEDFINYGTVTERVVKSAGPLVNFVHFQAAGSLHNYGVLDISACGEGDSTIRLLGVSKNEGEIVNEGTIKLTRDRPSARGALACNFDLKPVTNKGTITIDLGDYMSRDGYCFSCGSLINDGGKINLSVGNTLSTDSFPQLIGLRIYNHFKNLGSKASINVTAGNASYVCGIDVEGMNSTACVNEGQINVTVNAPSATSGYNFYVKSALTNTGTGKMNLNGAAQGLYLTGLLTNDGDLKIKCNGNIGLISTSVSIENTGKVYTTGNMYAFVNKTDLSGTDNILKGSANYDAGMTGLSDLVPGYFSGAYIFNDSTSNENAKTVYMTTGLSAAKDAAVADLQKAFEDGKYISTDAENALNAAIEAVLNATNSAGVTTAKTDGLATFAPAEKVYTDAKSAAKTTLQTALDQAVSDAGKAILSDALTAIGDDTILYSADIDPAVQKALEDAKAADKELTDAQAAAVATLEELGSTTYTTDMALDAMKDAIDAVNAAADADAVAAALEAGKSAMALADAKDKAITELEELGSTTYTSDAAQTAMKNAIDAVNAATDADAVAAALEAGKTAMQQTELQDAISEALAELEEAQKTAVSEKAKSALEQAITDVKAATTKAAVMQAKEAGLTIAATEDQALADAITAAVAELQKMGQDMPGDAAQAAMEDAIAAVKAATNTYDVDAALKAGKTAMLQAEIKDEILAAVEELSEARDNAITEEAKEALNQAIEKVNAATTVEEIETARDEGLKAAQEAEEALKNAIENAVTELMDAQNTASASALPVLQTAASQVPGATSVSEVEQILSDVYQKVFEDRYLIMDGKDAVWVQESEALLKFRSAAPFAEFDHVEIDDKTVPESEYTAEEGSTWITLKPGWLKKLADGKHTLVIVSKNGKARCFFTIKPKLPPTGDRTPLALLTLALFGAIGTATLLVKKQRRNNR